MGDFPELKDFVFSKYESEGVIEDYWVFRRKP
jgi:hypothetical protein